MIKNLNYKNMLDLFFLIDKLIFSVLEVSCTAFLVNLSSMIVKSNLLINNMQ